jgi:phosphonate dehydrogenase
MKPARPRIVVSNWVHDDALARLAAIDEVDANRAREPWSRAELAERVAPADALLAFMTDHVDADFLAACPRLKVIACALKGADNFDVEACTAAGVWVTIVPDLLTEPTAELAVALALGLGRRLREADALMRAGTFAGWRPILYGIGLDRSVVGIVGLGAVGSAIARRLAGFGCCLLGVDPGRAVPPGVARCDLVTALVTSDYLILAVPLAADTFHLIGRDALGRVKGGALLVNVGRGSVVDEAAVADALANGTLGGYAADVFEMEDWARPDRPRTIEPRLLSHPRTLFTPHLGSAVDRVRRDIALQAADDIADALCGRAPRHAVNEPVAPMRDAQVRARPSLP